MDADIHQLEGLQANPTPESPTNRVRHAAAAQQRPPVGLDASSADGSLGDAPPRRAVSRADSLASGLENSPSVPRSFLSSPGDSFTPSLAHRPGLSSPAPSFRPFDRRFQSRISSSTSNSPRATSPALLFGHSRNASVSTGFPLDQAESETPTPPWEVVRLTRLSKLTANAFSEMGRRNFGSPTCLAASASIVLGTSKGLVLVFDYAQNLKMIVGQGTKAAESGPVTSIAVSADHTTIAGGHANGNIFTWDMSRASRPFLSILHLVEAQARDGTADGHVANVPVLHLGFLGTRHTALVSADARGMAFSHLASRGTGPLGRTVKTTRILGRYPHATPPAGKAPKPSTVLAFAPLPLGNVERATDCLGLTAIITPYLLVIISTTPVARTQHKSVRPKDVASHSAMTGCLAWFPAVRLKVPDPASGSEISKVKLVYCWSNVLTVLDVNEIPSEDSDQPPSFRFKTRSRWKCEEAIVAVQWLSRSVLTLLTISQRLIVLEDRSLRMTEAFDLLQKHIFHKDCFSNQLHSLVEQLDDDDDQLMHGVVADAFYMSFKTYKGRIFLLGFGDVSIGALSNWADRLIAMMEHGDYVGAIRLGTLYFTGDADKLTIGLPEDTGLRHSMVQDKIMEMIAASLKYALGQRLKSGDEADNGHLRQLAEACFAACQAIGTTDYLFEDLYDQYEAADVTGIFHDTLEPYILDESITVVPPAVVKDMVSYYVTRWRESRLEEIICHMQTATLDLDQMMTLCKQHSLYDALTYVWNQAIGDYISPMIDLLGLLVPLSANGHDMSKGARDDKNSVDALKIFPYLSYVLTGRVYPSGEPMDEEAAATAKSEVYWFFFSGKTVEWPRGSGREFLTRAPGSPEPAFPYLRLMLEFEAPSFLSALNEAFEDSFLNDSPEKQAVNGRARLEMPEELLFGRTINRQYIVTILLDVMSPDSFTPEVTIYLDMFMARNLAKFPQYLLFSGSTLSHVLSNLCAYPGEDLAEDAQLSAEYLLSAYHPPDTARLMPLLREAGFYRILKRIYKVERQYDKLVVTYFEDEKDREAVFDCISDCLRPRGGLDARQLRGVRQVIEEHALDLLEIDAERTAATLESEEAATHRQVIDSAQDHPELQFAYLHTLLESKGAGHEPTEPPDRQLVESYVRLMCKIAPSRVSDYVGTVQSTDLRLEELLPTMEATGVVDAAVVLMARDGQVSKAIDRLIKHLFALESAAQGIAGVADNESGQINALGALEELLRSLQRYVHVGIWLCQGQRKTSTGVSAVPKKGELHAEGLSMSEGLWLNLIDACVQITKRLSPAVQRVDGEDGTGLVSLLRSLVQHTFTSLLNATSARAHRQPEPKLLSSARADVSFLRILRAFLAQAATASPNLTDLRGVLSSIFSAYAYEESILRLSNRLLEKSLFVSVNQAVELRQRGWRPRSPTCEACGKRVWGPGAAGGAVLEAWEERQALEEAATRERKIRAAERAKGNANGDHDGRYKGKSPDTRRLGGVAGGLEAGEAGKDPPLGPLVLLACRHMYHQSCLEELQDRQEDGNGGAGREREYRCPIDG